MEWLIARPIPRPFFLGRDESLEDILCVGDADTIVFNCRYDVLCVETGSDHKVAGLREFLRKSFGCVPNQIQ